MLNFRLDIAGHGSGKDLGLLVTGIFLPGLKTATSPDTLEDLPKNLRRLFNLPADSISE